jgi:hypothetical protein
MPKMEYVIFAIDNDADLHTNAKFLRHIDQQRAMQKLSSNMKLAIGCYKGKLERSYVLRKDDFEEFVLESGYVDQQESFLILRDGYYGVVYATLEYQSGDKQFLGAMVQVDPDEAMAGDAWTYRPDMDAYFVTQDV